MRHHNGNTELFGEHLTRDRGTMDENKQLFIKEVLSDFKKAGELPAEFIGVFEEILPEEIIYIWKEYGLGGFWNGYFRVIDPRAYVGIVEETFFAGEECVPLMTTAFGDVLVWDNEAWSLELVMYRYGIYRMVDARLFELLCRRDSEFINGVLEPTNYKEAAELLGEPDFDECFGYVPLLALGGGETPDHLKRCKAIEHIYLISQLAGKIEE